MTMTRTPVRIVCAVDTVRDRVVAALRDAGFPVEGVYPADIADGLVSALLGGGQVSIDADDSWSDAELDEVEGVVRRAIGGV